MNGLIKKIECQLALDSPADLAIHLSAPFFFAIVFYTLNIIIVSSIVFCSVRFIRNSDCDEKYINVPISLLLLLFLLL